MIIISLLFLLTAFTLDTNGAKLSYTYNDLAGGWLKFHSTAASWTDASIMCNIEDSVFASPATSQLRDAIKEYMSRNNPSHKTIYTGVQAVYENGDFASVDGIPLSNMPVYLEEGAPLFSSSESCVAWIHHNNTIKFVKCDENLPFVCFKKIKSKKIISCGTLDQDYKYESKSGSCYKFHHKRSDWTTAYRKCKSEGAYLAIINSQLESYVLKKIYKNNPQTIKTGITHVFLGIRDWLDGDSWKTVKGTNLEDAGFSTWGCGEPNKINGNEHCISMFLNGTYNDENCYLTLSFICEKNPEILTQSEF